jgi:hypothetical protein
MKSICKWHKIDTRHVWSEGRWMPLEIRTRYDADRDIWQASLANALYLEGQSEQSAIEAADKWVKKHFPQRMHLAAAPEVSA